MIGLYENIKKLCRQQKITVFDVEKAAGLGNNTVTTWGKVNPGIDKVARVAVVLGVTVDELIGWQKGSRRDE